MQEWKITCFDYDMIQDIQIREVQPNGYVRLVVSKEGDQVYHYFNKEQLFVSEQTDIRKEEGRDYKGINLVTFQSRPILFDGPTRIWFQNEIVKLRAKNVEYIDTVMVQSETIHELQNINNSHLAEISNLRRQLERLNPQI